MSLDVDKTYEIGQTNDTVKEVPIQFCMTSRFALLSWGYGKIILDIILLLITGEPLIELLLDNYVIYQIVSLVIFAFLVAVILADIIFHSKLVQGLRKNKLNFLTSYCQYTKAKWVLVLLSLAVFSILGVSGAMYHILRKRYLSDPFMTSVITIFLVTIIQSLMMLLVIKEIKKLKGEVSEVSRNKPRVYTFGFTVKIETFCTEKETENNNNNTDVTCDKAKLVE